jgi:3-methylcrotonyl-CoA carboxylase alpha subunit
MMEGRASDARQRHTRFPVDPWAAQDGWRNTGRQQRLMRFESSKTGSALACTLRLGYAARGYLVQSIVGEAHAATSPDLAPVCLADLAWSPESNTLSGLLGSERFQVNAFYDMASQTVDLFTERAQVRLKYLPLTTNVKGEAAAEGKLTAPMPGKVIALVVERGKLVKQGEALLVMEAMKMEHTMTAPRDGTVESFAYAVGDQVAEGALLLEFKPA